MISQQARLRRRAVGMGLWLLAAGAFVPPAGAQVVRMGAAAIPVRAAEAAAETGGEGAIPGLHLPRSRQVHFDHQMSDGEGFAWNIQYYGTVGSGTNNAYSGGMYCQLFGSNVRSNGRGWLNKAGDELEIGPRTQNGIQAWRRIKVYKDRGLARWLDILKNPSDKPVQAPVRIHTNTCWPIAVAASTSGDSTVDDKDWGFVTADGGHGNAPPLMHVFGTKRSKLRPRVTVSGNNITLNYNLTIPPGATVILCHFEAQGRSAAEVSKTLKSFRPRAALSDLSTEVRRRILNFPSGTGLPGLELQRIDSADLAVRRNGDRIAGRILNERFAVQAPFGQVDLPADRILAIVCWTDETVRMVLTDGQVVAGEPLTPRLRLKLETGGEMILPLDELSQFAFRIGPARPEELPTPYPLAVLRGGQRLTFDPNRTTMELRTRNGLARLDPKQVLRIAFDNPGHGVHRVVFGNGSRLSGFCNPTELTLALGLGADYSVRRRQLVQVLFGREPKTTPECTEVTLTNGDVLHGRLVGESFAMETAYGPQVLRREHLLSMEFSPTHLGRVAVRHWPNNLLRGQLAQERIAFEIAPGCRLDLHVNQIVAIRRPHALPPAEQIRRARELVGRLSSESYRDREAATEKLEGLDPSLAAVLAEYTDHSDPEVRQRIRRILNAMGASTARTAEGSPVYQDHAPEDPF